MFSVQELDQFKGSRHDRPNQQRNESQKHVYIAGQITVLSVAGLVTNGEFNSFRTRGTTGPVSIIAIRSNFRSKFAKMGKKKMLSILTPLGES